MMMIGRNFESEQAIKVTGIRPMASVQNGDPLNYL